MLEHESNNEELETNSEPEPKSIIRRRKHKRGINRTLTEEEYNKRKQEQQQQNNKKYYIRNLDRIRKNNLDKYHTMKENKKSIGRPKKY